MALSISKGISGVLKNCNLKANLTATAINRAKLDPVKPVGMHKIGK